MYGWVLVQISVHVPGAFEVNDCLIRWAMADKQYQQSGPSFLLGVEEMSSSQA